MHKPIVKLLPDSPREDQLINIIYVAARGCYSEQSAFEIWQEIESGKVTEEKKLALIERLCKDRHRTTLTHSMFSFSFDKVPIKIATQLTRSQVGTNFDQRSTRYLAKWTKGRRAYDYAVQPIRLRDDGKFPMIEEPQRSIEIAKKAKANEIIEQCYSMCAQAYEDLRALGVTAEDASYVLNLGAYTGLTASFNIVSFRHWINTRKYHVTGKAQEEHSELASIALEEFTRNYPKIAAVLFKEAQNA